MDIFVARQPIFDKSMNTFGYELLYRRSNNNFYEGVNDLQATSELISNAYLTMRIEDITHGSKAFINFSESLIIDEIPLLLPHDQVVIEVLETVNPTPEIINACKKLKAKGYTIALDDFNYEERFMPLIELADIIKVEYNDINKPCNIKLLNDYSGKIEFLAEKVETREEYQIAIKKGYSLFQGYFFSKPDIIKSKKIGSLNTTLVQVIAAINEPEVDYQKITETVERDISVSHKLLKIVNSVGFGGVSQIYSIKQALVRLGAVEIEKWCYLMMLQELKSSENAELIRTSIMRAKAMELIATEYNLSSRRHEFFMTGMFSSIDILMDQPMASILAELPFTEDVKDALINKENIIRKYLDIVLAYESANWVRLEESTKENLIDNNLTTLYLTSYRWATNIK